MALSFRPVLQSNPDQRVELETVHEMDMHLLIVSQDLSYFAHEHPTPDSGGNYTVRHVFPHGGPYVLFEDFTPRGEEQQLGRQELTVLGEARPPVPLPEETRTWQEGEYELRIAGPSLPFQVREPVEVKVSVKKAGRPVTDLEDYLGALVHVVIISEDTSRYLHVHPMPSPAKGPQVAFHTVFPEPGKYKVFFQFGHAGQVRTASFVVAVQKQR